ncbi:MAG: serine/threonine-protein kinase [Isosphaeraceae bacterium]
MNEVDGRSNANSSGAAAEDEVELEPTAAYPAIERGSPDRSFHMALVAGSAPSITRENEILLRSRLKAAVLFLAVVYALFLVFGLMDPSSTVSRVGLFIGIRVVLCIAVGALLASPVELDHARLRILEYGFFGALIVFMMVAQYVGCSSLIREGDFSHLVASEKNGVLNFLVVIVLYGVFIPNKPSITARVVLTMALGPLIVLVLLQLLAEKAPNMIDQLAESELTIANSLFILVGAALAIYTSYVLNGLRQDLKEARRLGHYQLGDKLGEGGMGEVYLAEHQLLKRPCALKLIKPDVDTNPLALARFEREVQSAAMLSHPNTIEIFDYGHSEDGTFYYVMEFLPGMSLSDLVRQYGPLPPGRAVYLLRQVCGALAEAHRLRLVHRDLKPANLFVAILGGKCDVAKVLDFGLVKLTAPEATQLTADYTVSGTPLYMSPEQAMGASEIDGRADVYALGAILYFMLTGHPPFEGATPTELMIAHARDPVTPPSKLRPDIPADLEAVALRCLAKKPDERFPGAREMAFAMGACACAGEWDEIKAEEWWADRAVSELEIQEAAETARLAAIPG